MFFETSIRITLLKKLTGLYSICLATILATPTTYADTEAAASTSWEFGGSVASLSIDSESAGKEGVKDTAFTLQLFADYQYKSKWLTTLGADFVGYSDNEGFTNNTTGGVMSSNASGFLLAGSTGPMWRFGDDKQVITFTQLGMSSMMSSERNISNCSNCDVEEIDIDAGGFIRVGALYNFEHVAIGATIHHYLSGDLDNSIGFTLTTSY